MKKVFIFVMTLFIACASFAQESNRDANGKIQYGPYETNSFLSNWFVEVGGGVNVPVDGVTKTFNGGLTYDFGGLSVNANIGKWIDPCYGVRLGWQGLTTGNLDNKISFKESFDGTHSFNYIHGDFMLNFSNLVAGYKETRAVNVVPYVTAGTAFAEWNTRRSFALGGGIQVPVRVSDRVSIVPEVQLVAMNSRVYGGSQVTGNASANVSVRVNLGKTNWTRKATTVSYYEAINAEKDSRINTAEEAINVLNAKNDELLKRNDVLYHDVLNLKEENTRLKEELADASRSEFDNFVVYFDLGKTRLSDKEEAHLVQFMNKTLKSNSKVKVYVAGASDTSTGTVNRNAYLRKERAAYVANLLHRTYDVEVEIVENGVEDIDVPSLSRAAVVTWE